MRQHSSVLVTEDWIHQPCSMSILIQACNLKSQVFHYDISLDDCIHSTSKIYVLPYCEELPIVIDTSAGNSITPNDSDFIGKIHKANLSSLEQVNETTPVCGQCNIGWDIEDFHVVSCIVITKAYHVPSATI